MNRITFAARQLLLVVTVAFALSTVVDARYRRPDLANVPVKELITNLQKKVEANPKDANLRMNLARVYAMAFAQKSDSLQVNKGDPLKAWFGYAPTHVPFSYVKNSDDKEKNAAAKKFLEQALEHFKKAVELDKDNLTAKLSLAWCFDQSGNDMEAISRYREIIKLGWKEEQDKTRAGLGWHSIVAEAAGYLIPKLDKEKGKQEIADLQAKVAHVSKIRRPITPIAIGLRPSMQLGDLVDRNVKVPFDLDGTRSGKHWSWISSDAAWLVFDKKGNGKIDSGLQLFGNVTFWCFWENGYQALSSLDANCDGKLSGAELKHVGLWHDINQNGISESGEVKSVSDYKIIEINCRYQTLNRGSDDARDSIDAVATSQQGLKFSDGSTRATYDIVLHQR